jgi:hypothetical protein
VIGQEFTQLALIKEGHNACAKTKEVVRRPKHRQCSGVGAAE